MLPYLPPTVAEAIAALLDQAAAERGRCTLAIPGGRSPGPVLTALAGILTPFVRERLHLLWLDERAVPLGHADRNDAPTLAAWREGEPRLERWTGSPAAAQQRRPVWPLVGLLWLSAALITAAALVALAALLG